MNKVIFATFSLSLFICSYQTKAVITYANCPTLQPLPITNFMPGAMVPIKNAQNSYTAGGLTIKTAVQTGSLLQAQAIDSAFTSIMKNLIDIQNAKSVQLTEVDRQYSELKIAYEMELANQKSQLESMLFPGDPSMMPVKPGEERIIDPNSPSYKFVMEMCSSSKMQRMMGAKSVRDKVVAKKNRRGQQIVSNIQAVNSISSASKASVDKHYELFCSDDDFSNHLCEAGSAIPNGDLEAYVFLYPTGVPSSNTDAYRTNYTYSPVESLASYQYIKNLTGSLYLPPLSEAEKSNASRIRASAFYKQLVSSLSVATEALLQIASSREPLNSQGTIMSEMDALNYMVNKGSAPEHRRVVKSASENGKLIEMQKQLALTQSLRFSILKQKDMQRILMAADIALENTLSSYEM